MTHYDTSYPPSLYEVGEAGAPAAMQPEVEEFVMTSTEPDEPEPDDEPQPDDDGEPYPDDETA